MTLNGDFTVVNKATEKVVCDAGPIIHLDELDSVHLLSDFREILVGPLVRAEIAGFRPFALAKIDQFTNSPVVAPSQDPVLLSLCKVFALDAGEMEAVLLMKQFPASILLTDDAAARVVAERIGFRVH
jgi:predicted nucleic acid-binding protein